MERLTIKEIINNMRNELDRAESVLSWLYTEYSDVYSKIQNSELGDILTQDIRNELDRAEDLLERIDYAMLMSATVGDIAIPMLNKIYDLEARTELPYNKELVDTETVYNTIEDAVKELKSSN